MMTAEKNSRFTRGKFLKIIGAIIAITFAAVWLLNVYNSGNGGVESVKLAHLVGRRMLVDYPLLKDLHVHLVTKGGRKVLVVEGSIMESAKVFDTLKVTTSGDTIFITVHASLVFWNRGGSPDFKATSELTLRPGIYDVLYAGTDGETTFLKKIDVVED